MKQPLRDIKRTTNVTTKALAECAQLPVADVFTVEVGGFVSRDKAQRVITAFNQLSGKWVTLDDIVFLTSHSQGSSNLPRGFYG